MFYCEEPILCWIFLFHVLLYDLRSPLWNTLGKLKSMLQHSEDVFKETKRVCVYIFYIYFLLFISDIHWFSIIVWYAEIFLIWNEILLYCYFLIQICVNKQCFYANYFNLFYRFSWEKSIRFLNYVFQLSDFEDCPMQIFRKIKFSIHEYNISLMYWPNLLNIFPRIKFEFLNIFNPQLFNISRQSEIGFSSWLFIRIKTSVIRLFTFGGFFRISYSLWLPMRLCFPKPFDI